MLSLLKRPALAVAFVALAPLAAVLPGLATDAQAHTYVRGGFQVDFPAVVIGYSYGDPYAYGHVHRSPVACSHGPIYYYPRQGVYAHYYPRYQYYGYAAPYPRHVRIGRPPLPPHVRFIRSRLRDHAEHLRSLWREVHH